MNFLLADKRKIVC